MVVPFIYQPSLRSVKGSSISQGEDQLRYDAGNTSASDATFPQISVRSAETYIDGGVWWYAARLDDVLGKTPTIFLDLNDYHGNSQVSAVVHNAWWSYGADTDDWFLFDNESYSGETLTVSNDAAFARSVVYVANFPMYQYARFQRKLRQWASSGIVDPTPSGAGTGEDLSPFVIGTQTARSCPIDSRSIPALDAYAFKITGTGVSKNVMVLTNGVHPGETLAAWILEGAIEYVLYSSEAAAVGLREWADIYVYPTLDPQGLWAGYYRSTPEAPSLEANRNWDDRDVECYNIHRAALLADEAVHGGADVAIDHHNYNHANSNGNFGLGFYFWDEEAIEGAFIDAMQVYEPDVEPIVNTGSSSMTMRGYLRANVLKTGLLTLTMEGPPIRTRQTTASYKAFGANQMRALWDMTVAGQFTVTPP